MKRNLECLCLLLALLSWPELSFAQSPPARLLTTITNPTPARDDFFAASVAAMGNNRLLIGADGGGAAYLFSTNGKLLTTFTVSDPAAGGFGNPAVAVGDRVAISAYSYGTTGQNGRVYLFSTNGALTTTFTNPNPARLQAFGVKLAALGNDRVLIGGVADLNKSAPYLGAVYLFGTNGILQRTFTNPAPAFRNGFGESVAALGNDRVLVGAYADNRGATQAGAAYLFSTNGTLLTTFTNPVPVANDNFGWAIAAVGTERVLISAIDGGNFANGGAGYLFNTNGVLLTTFTNPTPATADNFGWAAEAMGDSRVLISAYQDSSSGYHSGSAYLFSTNGTLLNTFTNPTPAMNDDFGWSVAAVGKDRVIIGALFDDTGAIDTGAAYLFELPYPSLNIARKATGISVSWVTAETGLMLQESSVLGGALGWSNTTDSVFVNAGTNVVQPTSLTTNRFFRLQR